MSTTIDAPGALAVIPASAISTIVSADQNDILGKLGEKIAAFRPDVSSIKGRKEIASIAAEVASSKMDLIRLGKSMTEGWRKQTAAVNAECKIIEERMDELKVQVRAPLTAFEEIEKARIAVHERHLKAMSDLFDCLPPDAPPSHIKQSLDCLEDYEESVDWQEFVQRASDIHAATRFRLTNMLTAALARDEAARLAEQRRLEEAEAARVAAEKAQRERDARIAAEAAEAARVAAEARAAEAAAMERQRFEQERLDAEEARRIEADRARQAEERAAQAERDRLAAEKRAEAARVEAAAQAERDRAIAIAAERARVAIEQEAERKAADARERDLDHMRECNGEMLLDLITECPDVTEEIGKAIIKAVAKKRVRHMEVRY
jgi:hypothetical protein